MLIIARLFCIFSFLFSSIAWGHAFPYAQSPGANATIPSQPTVVSIEFDADIEPVFSSIRVFNAQQKQVSKGNGAVLKKENYFLQTQIPALPTGTYQVVWKVIARDGHQTKGNYRFMVK